MAPISNSPAAPQATHRISSGLPATLQGSKQLVIYVAAVVMLGFLFLLAGVYLLYVHRRLSRPGKAARTIADAEVGEGRIKLERSRAPISRKYSSTTTGDQDVTTQTEKHDDMALESEYYMLKPPARSTAGPRPSSLSDDEVERMRLLAFKFPPVQESGQDNMHVAPDVSVFRAEAKGTSDTSIAVQSAEAVRPSAFGTHPVEEKRSRRGADRGESTLKRLDAIIAQEPTFAVPEETLPLVATDSTRHARVMNLLDDILAQEPPPLSPDVLSPSLDSPTLATPPIVTTDQALKPLQPLGLAQLQHLPDEPRVVVLVEASPRLTQRYLVHPVLKTWSKLTGRGDLPLISHPAIIVEDAGIGELPMQSSDDIPLFDFGTSPEIDYLTPSWNVSVDDEDDEEEEEEPVYESPRIVTPIRVRWFSPFVKPKRSQLREMSPQPAAGRDIGPGNALGLSMTTESAFDTEDPHVDLVVPSRAIIPTCLAYKTAVEYGYF
ncbi:hypothetical protein FOMPIDRAFT_89970 [Fomitopsis schrenkii]|uniref:Uncharacterized protein n=1 Tax=Fomitopsis schrenkii TaxID=2126942 RepID=S8E3L6_FOMSC|nr:hypothetical protein FOMPIDRAFT_89970 [Fomitopsis schrenkii]